MRRYRQPQLRLKRRQDQIFHHHAPRTTARSSRAKRHRHLWLTVVPPLADIDPFEITITSIAANLTWDYNGSSRTYASASADEYEFPYDGWTNNGLQPINFITPGDGSILYQEYDTFINYDFALLMYSLLGPGGYALCGFNNQPAVFNLNPTVRGSETAISAARMMIP